MGRRNNRRRDFEPADDGPLAFPSNRRVEEHPDGDWIVQSITGSASTKAYRCPGCDQEIRPATPHIVAWPFGSDSDVQLRRHWHTPCWGHRSRRKPTRG